MKALRKDINTWVATYRREPRVSGRPSYGYVRRRALRLCLRSRFDVKLGRQPPADDLLDA